MAKSYSIHVRYDSSNGVLKIQPATQTDLVLAPDTSPIYSVRWLFEGIEGLVAAGWIPGISFTLDPTNKGSQYTGPFINLTKTKSAVIASGNTGASGRYRYRAALRPPIGSTLPKIQTTEARLFNQVAELTPSVVKVKVPPDNQGFLQVDPEYVTCTAGQSIFWEILGAGDEIGEWYPRLYFQDGPDGMNSHLGPFTSLDTRSKTILASGSGGQPGQYKYLFQMVSVDGGDVRFQSSPDPIVDDEGEPPGAEGEPPNDG